MSNHKKLLLRYILKKNTENNASKNCVKLEHFGSAK